MGVKTTGTGITDASSHAFLGLGVTASDAVRVNAPAPGEDLVLPTVSSFTGSLTGSTATFTLTFSEDVTGVDASDFIVNTSDTATATIGTISGSGTTYTIPVTVGGNGVVSLTVVGGASADIRDAATNWFAGGGTSTSATVTVGGTSGGGGSGGSVPVVTNASVTGTVGTPIAAVQVNATNSPTSFTAPGLATFGLSIDATGSITGTPTKTATNATVSVLATNSSGTSTPATITLNIAAASGGGGGGTGGGGTGGGGTGGGTTSAPSVTAPATVTGTVGVPLSFYVTATNSPTSFNMTGGPAGISINEVNGLVSGTPTASGNYTASVSASNSAGSGTATISFTINDSSTGGPVKKGQTVIFNVPTGAIVIGTPIHLGATSDSGGAITYTIISGNATLVGDTLTIKGNGPVVVRATQAGDATWDAASTDTTFIASKAHQTITLHLNNGHHKANESITLDATSSSGLPVTYTLISGPATLSGNTLTFTGSHGTVVIRVSQAGDDTYDAAADENLTFTVDAVGEQVFFGKLGSDDLAAAVNADNTKGTILVRLSSTGEALVAKFDIAADGTFSAKATSTMPAVATGGTSALVLERTFTGTVNNGAISGAVAELGLNFTAHADAATGPSSPYTGLYTARIPGSASGDAYLVVGSNGEAYALVVTPSSVVSGMGTVSASGAVSVTTSGGGTITGKVDPSSSAITGDVDLGTSSEHFAGLSAATVATDRLINVSSRLRVSGNDTAHATIAGFVVTGDTPKQILIRAVGPTLSAFGIKDGLTDPGLRLYDGTGKLVASNDGWADDAAIKAAADSTGAFQLGAHSKDSALLVTLTPGLYTAQVSSNNNGIVLIEVYDVAANASVPTKQLINISTRGFVGTGDDVLIGGFAVTGNQPKRVLIRAVGPGLAQFGVTGTVSDPMLTVYDSKHVVIAKNDNWGTPQAVDSTQIAATASDITTAESATGAFPLATGSADAAVIITLNPGTYSAVVNGAGGATGAAMIEVYEIPNP
jgi:hypothetical protein